MNPKFNQWRLYWVKYREKGIVLPIAIGVGVITALTGVMMLNRSFKDQTDVIARQSLTGSAAVSEAGISKLRALMNTYRAIATFNSCADNDTPPDGIPDWSGGNCDNISGSTAASWKAADLIESIATKAYGQTISASDVPICNDNSVATFVSSQATQQWQDISDQPTDGQYRLVDYQFLANDPNDMTDNVGKLVVQGRFRQQGTGASATESAGTGNSKMEITFPIEQETAGMWISNHQNLEVPNTGTMDAHIQDSGCAVISVLQNNAATNINQLRNIQTGGKEYISMPQKPFPDLPERSTLPPLLGSNGNWVLDETVYMPDPSDTINYTFRPPTSGVVSRPALEDSGNTIAYRFGDGHISFPPDVPSGFGLLDIRGTGKIIVDAPGKTVKIRIDEDLTISEQGSIEVTEGTTLILMVRKNIELLGDAYIENHPNNPPENLQIYHYNDLVPGVLPSKFRMTGYSKIKRAFIFAPYIDIEQSGTSEITGSLWARSWKGEDSPRFIQMLPNFDQLLVSDPDYFSGGTTPATTEDYSFNRIGRINSWRQCRFDLTVDCQQ